MMKARRYLGTSIGIISTFILAYYSNACSHVSRTTVPISTGTLTLTPMGGPVAGGNTLLISGAPFGSGTTVQVGGNSCPVIDTTSTTVSCTVPAG